MPYIIQDFTTYIEEDDQSKLTVISNKITITNLNRKNDTMSPFEEEKVYKDFGVDYFSGDFTHKFTAQMDTDGTDFGIFVPWSLQSVIDGVWGAGSNTSDHALFLYLYDLNSTTVRAVLGYRNAYTEYTVTYSSLSKDTPYYFTIIRTGTTLTCDIYSDSSRQTLITQLSKGLPSVAKHRYLFALNKDDQSYVYDASGFVQDFFLFVDVANKPTWHEFN